MTNPAILSKDAPVLSVSTLIGNPVKDTNNEDLGKIEELMLNTQTGRIAYAVLSLGDLLGLGGKLFAIPWSLFTLDRASKCFVLDVPKGRLKNAPGFDKKECRIWPTCNGVDRSTNTIVKDLIGLPNTVLTRSVASRTVSDSLRGAEEPTIIEA